MIPGSVHFKRDFLPAVISFVAYTPFLLGILFSKFLQKTMFFLWENIRFLILSPFQASSAFTFLVALVYQYLFLEI